MNPQGRRSRPGEGDFWQIPMLNLISTKGGADYLKLARSCRPVRYFGTLFWDDITIFWDENLSFNWQTEKNPVLDQ